MEVARGAQNPTIKQNIPKYKWERQVLGARVLPGETQQDFLTGVMASFQTWER